MLETVRGHPRTVSGMRLQRAKGDDSGALWLPADQDCTRKASLLGWDPCYALCCCGSNKKENCLQSRNHLPGKNRT